jgi:hypothetical protein
MSMRLFQSSEGLSDDSVEAPGEDVPEVGLLELRSVEAPALVELAVDSPVV